MLLEFSITNFRSICEKQTLNLVPAPKQKDFLDNITHRTSFFALNAAALYGANASGKSNFIKAMSLMDFIIHTSSSTASTARLPYEPFLLRDGFSEKPCTFEVVFVKYNTRYRYGFSFDKTAIKEEWLYRKVTGREVPLFIREGDTIDVRNSFCGKKTLVDTAIEATRDNGLFLSQSDSFNIKEAKNVLAWFDSLTIINGIYTEAHESKTVELWKDPFKREVINRYLKEISIEVKGVDVKNRSMSKDNNVAATSPIKGMEEYTIQSIHQTYDDEGHPKDKTISWNFGEHESEGSIKLLQMIGPIVWALVNGGILIIDEIEAKLHPILTLKFIDMFLDINCNPKGSQLIFATHDTNLLSYARLRRDQIYFCEKNKWEGTEMFSLSDFVYFGERDGKTIVEKERKDSDKERRYMEGRYGAIPLLGKFKENIMNILWQEKVN